MATVTQIKSAVNARLADWWPKIKAKQEIYASNHGGNYWQGIAFSTVPDDGALVTPNFAVAPTDHPTETWEWASAKADLPAQVECQITIDVYGKTGGPHGYYATVRVSKSGVTYRRTAQVEDGVEITTGEWEVEDAS